MIMNDELEVMSRFLLLFDNEVEARSAGEINAASASSEDISSFVLGNLSEEAHQDLVLATAESPDLIEKIAAAAKMLR